LRPCGQRQTDEGDAIAREAYGCNYDRLVALKNKYDPTNFFRLNHNIQPTKAAQAARRSEAIGEVIGKHSFAE